MASSAHTMKGGDGQYSYYVNSTGYKQWADQFKKMQVAGIVENLDIENKSAGSSFRIADLGCSVGPNTFFAVDNIIEALAQKYQMMKGLSAGLPEIQVYFSDLVSNDFNKLFASLPKDVQYFAAAVPGSFYGRLFPKASLDIVYSHWALQWLSKVPQEIVLDSKSPAFNKGRIMYANSSSEVVQAFSDQYAKDMEAFFQARAQELAPEGLMLLLVPGRPDGTLPAQHSFEPLLEPMESCLIDMVNEGLIKEDKLDSFNLPIYVPSIEELRKIIQTSQCFDELRMEIQIRETPTILRSESVRSGLENTVVEHFGNDIIEPLFERYSKKLVGRSPITFRDGYVVGLFVLLKRNP